ncbi:MAG: MopE-related protein, partial [Myxococcota bacterium]
MRIPSALALVLLTVQGCEGDKNDADGDGYSSPEDCDDTDVNVGPGGIESCDGIDNDCDGETDEGLTAQFYPDTDADQHGDLNAAPLSACEAPSGYLLDHTDCDDGNPAAHPGAAEDCDPADLNCDGDPYAGATDLVSWYLDDDLDGFGDAANAVQACEPVTGYVADASDCDDIAADTHPGAPELCDGGIDNDCDPATSDDSAPDAPTWYTDADGDDHGDALKPVQACLEPADGAALGDDCDDTDATSYPGNIEFCDGGIDNDCDPTTDEALTAVWYRDLDEDGYGVDTDTVTGCSPPAGYVQLAGDCDDTDPSLNPGTVPDCIMVHCGTISLSETWKATVTHHVTCDVVVEGAAKPTLTVEDGVLVLFDPLTELKVGKTDEAKLIVNGDTLGVTFTSNDPFPAPGDWDGLTLGVHDRGSVVTGLVVAYAGSNGKGGVVVDGGNPTFDRLTSRNNLGDGVNVSASEPLIHDSQLIDNTNNGLFVGANGGLARTAFDGSSGPSFTDNVVTGNAGRPITIPGSHADELSLTSTLTPNDLGEIELLAGTLRFTGTWFDHPVPYVVADSATILVEDGPQAHLTIEDGVEVFFGVSSGLTIGDGDAGQLDLDDGPDGILFSATADVIASSDNWDGLKLGANDDGSLVQNLTVEYGGGNGKGNIYVVSSAPTISSVLSRLSDSAGMYVGGTGAAPEIRDSTFLDNDEDGVFVESTSGIARSVLGPTFVNNLLTGNGQSSVVLPPNFIGELDPSTAFSGNGDRVGIHGGEVLEDALWRKLDEDYEIRGDVDIAGPQDPVVEIEDEASIFFDRDTVLAAGVADDGALVVEADLGVLFTSSDVAPGEGDWEGVEVGRNGGLRPQTRLRGLTIEFAGGSDVADGGALELLDRDVCGTQEPLVDLDDLTIVGSSKAALFAEKFATFSADGLVMTGALDGCVRIAGSPSCQGPDIVSYTDNDCVDGVVFGSWALAEVDALAGAGNTFPGPVVIEDTTLTSSVSMPALPVPYEFTESVRIGVTGGATLTIESGAELRFDSGAGLEVGTSSQGDLVLEPNVLFTSVNAVGSPGDWDGIKHLYQIGRAPECAEHPEHALAKEFARG